MRFLFSFGSGLVFAVGLLLSGMTNPSKVLAFLDIAGSWDPSLALVMAGAIAVATPAFYIAKRRQRSFLDLPIQLPQKRSLNARLIWGSLLFGAGWGVAGFCPGPALLSAASGQPKALVFIAAMLLGMGVFALLERAIPIKNP